MTFSERGPSPDINKSLDTSRQFKEQLTTLADYLQEVFPNLELEFDKDGANDGVFTIKDPDTGIEQKVLITDSSKVESWTIIGNYKVINLTTDTEDVSLLDAITRKLHQDLENEAVN